MLNNEQISRIKSWLGNGSINLFGRPFAGKDSQGNNLVELLGGHLIGGGDILRNSVIPERVKDYLRVGLLIPSEDYVNIVLPYLSQEYLSNAPLMLSSVGRWHGEEVGVIEALEKASHELKAVIYIHLTEENVRVRWQDYENRKDRGDRYDDSEHILETRFVEFREKTLPVVDFYRANKLLIEIDGTLPREEVTQNILNALEEFAAKTN